jgi:hypothetical protein
MAIYFRSLSVPVLLVIGVSLGGSMHPVFCVWGNRMIV